MNVQEITKITVDGVEKPVVEFSPELQALVGQLNAWRVDEAVALDGLQKIQHAIRSLGMSIEVKLKGELAPKVDVADGEVSVDTVADDVVNPTVQ